MVSLEVGNDGGDEGLADDLRVAEKIKYIYKEHKNSRIDNGTALAHSKN